MFYDNGCSRFKHLELSFGLQVKICIQIDSILNVKKNSLIFEQHYYFRYVPANLFKCCILHHIALAIIQ